MKKNLTTDREAVTYLVERMVGVGASIVALDDGEEVFNTERMYPSDVLDTLMFEVEAETLHFQRGGDYVGVYLVYGNEPYEVVNDWRGPEDGGLWDELDLITSEMDPYDLEHSMVEFDA